VRLAEASGLECGSTLSNAYFGRALCFAKLGQPPRALAQLDCCVRCGPDADEQLGDGATSLVPSALVARLVLHRRHPGLAPAAQARAAAAAAKRSKALEPSFQGRVWRVPATALELAFKRCRAAGRTPLLLDGTAERVADSFFLYQPATIVEAKQLVVARHTVPPPPLLLPPLLLPLLLPPLLPPPLLPPLLPPPLLLPLLPLLLLPPLRCSIFLIWQVPRSLGEIREALRADLVHALRWGHTL
jgi:hypothetical protein